jgi:hypothetical protein
MNGHSLLFLTAGACLHRARRRLACRRAAAALMGRRVLGWGLVIMSSLLAAKEFKGEENKYGVASLAVSGRRLLSLCRDRVGIANQPVVANQLSRHNLEKCRHLDVRR